MGSYRNNFMREQKSLRSSLRARLFYNNGIKLSTEDSDNNAVNTFDWGL